MSKDVPETIIWLITPRCNLNCMHCYAVPYKAEKELPERIVLKVVEDVADSGVSHIHYTGGEPLLRPDMRGIIEHTLSSGVDASLFTNATVIRPDIIKWLSKVGIRVYTSMEGHVKQLYEAHRGARTWESFVRCVKNLVEEGVEIHINVAVTELNWMHIKDIIIKAHELGASSISMIPSMPVGNALESKVYVTPKHLAKALIMADEAARELGIEINVWCVPFLPAVLKSRKLKYSNCRNTDIMDVTPSGKVILCDIMGHVVADIVEDGVRGAWMKLKNSSLSKAVMKPVRERPCATCIFRPSCMGGCYARAFLKWGKVEMPDPLCPIVFSQSSTT